MKIYISHFILIRGPLFIVSWEIDRETYTQRKDFFFPYPPPGARRYQCLHPLARSSETPLIGYMSHVQLQFSALCLNLTAWFSLRDLLPVTHLLYPTVQIMLPCLLITMWRLVKAHGVTMNKPKIHGICYITLFQSWLLFFVDSYSGLSSIFFYIILYFIHLYNDIFFQSELFASLLIFSRQSRPICFPKTIFSWLEPNQMINNLQIWYEYKNSRVSC